LDNHRELYIKRPVFVADTKESELHIGSDYKCKSNKIILDTLIKIDSSSKKSEKSIRSLILGDCSKQLKVMNDIPSSEIEKIEESGSKNRKKLIRLCKLYQQNKDIDITSESTGKNAEIEREYKLAEKCLTKYSKNVLEGLEVRAQYKFGTRGSFASVIKPDMILIKDGKALVIDYKVYSEISQKQTYSWNDNRYQVNGYMDAVLGLDGVNHVEGVILHIVNEELWKQNEEYQNYDLSLSANTNKLSFHMIQDKGLEYIFNAYEALINNYFNQFKE
jgi:hypothetical protein